MRYCAALSTALFTLTIGPGAPARDAGATKPAGDEEIRRMVREIDAANIEHTVLKLVSFGTRNTLSSQTDPNRGIGAARDWLYTELQKISNENGGRLKVEMQSFDQSPGGRIPKTTRLSNIIATLPGEASGPNAPVLIVSGHYDSMCSSPTNSVDDAPGANDDASGTAAVVELARVMSKHRFRKSIVFMAVPGEEQGLLGSTHFAEQARRSNVNVEAMFTNDIIGGSTGGNGVHDDRSVRVFSEGIPSDETPAQATARRSVGGENDGASRQLSRFVAESANEFVRGFRVTQVWRRDRYGRGGDHIPFTERGYPAIRFTEPNEDFRHQHQNVRTENGTVYGDLPEFVDFQYVAKVTRLNCAALAAIALAPSPPSGVRILTGRLSHDTEIRWQAGDPGQIKGYEIVWRTTEAPNWTHRKSVGNLASITMTGLSKDNFLFGVRAVGKDGKKSVVAYPRSGRE
jgi:hypothetical protein